MLAPPNPARNGLDRARVVSLRGVLFSFFRKKTQLSSRRYIMYLVYIDTNRVLLPLLLLSCVVILLLLLQQLLLFVIVCRMAKVVAGSLNLNR